MSNPSRWIAASSRLPPPGVPVQVKAFRSWCWTGCDQTVRMLLETQPGDAILSMSWLERRGRELSCVGTVEYRNSMVWRFAHGTPTPRVLAAGVRRVARYQAAQAEADSRARAQALARWHAWKVRRRHLESLPAEQVERVTSSQKVHFQMDPEDWRIRSNPFVQSYPRCGALHNGPMTVVAAHVTCARCRAQLR